VRLAQTRLCSGCGRVGFSRRSFYSGKISSAVTACRFMFFKDIQTRGRRLRAPKQSKTTRFCGSDCGSEICSLRGNVSIERFDLKSAVALGDRRPRGKRFLPVRAGRTGSCPHMHLPKEGAFRH
jgi:hypothetical protein